MTMEVQCRFTTSMPERYQVPQVEINITSSATAKDLTRIVKQLIIEENEGDEALAQEIA